jgi:hypothetical protein
MLLLLSAFFFVMRLEVGFTILSFVVNLISLKLNDVSHGRFRV